MSLTIEAVNDPTDALRREIETLAGEHEPAWYTTLNADRARPAWFLARREGVLVGFLTVFDPSGQAAEVEAFVAPSQRRQGVFTALLAEARRVWEAPGRRWLLVASRGSEGATVAARWGNLSFTESTLGLPVSARPRFEGLPDGLLLRAGGEEEVEAAAQVFQAAHGEEDGHRSFLERIVTDPDRRFLALLEGEQTVGVGCLHRDGSRTMVHGLVVHPSRQGRGWGRALLEALLDLGASDTEEFLIEVDSSNARAEGLYRSLGFTDREVTDYYEIAATG